MSLRTTPQRIADARHSLATADDVWIATASLEGIPHLIPLSLAWIDEKVMCVTYTDSVTARNVAATSIARCSLESTTNVVIMRTNADLLDLGDCDPEVVQEMVTQFGWDPRRSPDIAWSVLTMTPVTIHAWQGEPEIKGRTIMRDCEWVD